jgi:probable rRNA maturation factor
MRASTARKTLTLPSPGGRGKRGEAPSRGAGVVSAVVFKLHVIDETGAGHVAFLRKHLRSAHRILDPSLRELSLALVGDSRMSTLHREFMNIPGPTDVLTFPIDLDRRGRAVSGEIVICVPEARRAAKSHGTSVRHELLLYAIHGMLHLAGFDDRTETGFRKMHRTEDDILTRLGIGRVFAAPARRAPGAR